jgi:membrane associated rhomboid family serine protease
MIIHSKISRLVSALPFLTLAISAVMVAVMLFGRSAELYMHDQSTGLTRLVQTAASTMSHFSTFHLLMNLVTVAIFGSLVEYAYGRVYILAVLATCIVLIPFGVPDGGVYAGASPFAIGLGAFALVGVLKYRAVLRQRTTKVLVATLAFSLAAVSVPVQIGVDVVNLGNPVEASEFYVAHGAHLFGAAAGGVVAVVAVLTRSVRRSVPVPVFVGT